MAGLGGVLVASDAADMISVDPIELNDLFGGSKKTGPGFVGDDDGVDKVAEGVLENRGKLQTESLKRKTGEVLDGNGVDGALIVDTGMFSGVEV